MIDADERLLLRALLDRDTAAAATASTEYLARVDVQTLPWRQTRMFPALYRRMTAAGLETPGLLKGTYRRSWAQNHTRFRAAASTMARLEAAGIRHAVLKGASLVPAYGGDWGVRDMADVDVLVARADVRRSIEEILASGFVPHLGGSAEGIMARTLTRRHSWNFIHPDGPNLDLHWFVLQDSRGPYGASDFLDAAVPLELGSVRTARLCDGDLLLHVLEHAGHGEDPSELIWRSDVVHIVRATADLDGAARRLTRQAESHDLVAHAAERLEEVLADIDDDGVALFARALHNRRRRRVAPAGSRREEFAIRRRGGASSMAAARAYATDLVDGQLAARPRAWSAYVALGRRPLVERCLIRRRGPLTSVPTPGVPAADGEGWWDLWRPEIAESLLGPGWSYSEAAAETVWNEGVEARLSLPAPVTGPVTVELDVVVLGRHGGPARSVSIRANGRELRRIEAEEVDWHHLVAVRCAPLPRTGTVELSVVVDRPARPCDLGLGVDRRRIGFRARRVRIVPLDPAGQ